MHFLAFFLQNQPDPEAIRQALMVMMAVIPIVIIVCLAVVLVPFWFICKKAGFSPWLTFLNVVPLGGVILWYVLAFSEWKVVPAPQPAWMPQPPFPTQSPFPPQPPVPPQA
jgi:hypothetical protein